MGQLDVSWSRVTKPGVLMAGKNSFLRQTQALTQSALPVQYPVPSEIFQLIDPPTEGASPDKVVHRDAEVFKISITTTTPGTTETLFQVLSTEDDAVVDLLGGDGILPEDETYLEWWLVPRPVVTRMLTRLSINVTQVGEDATGIIFEVLFV